MWICIYVLFATILVVKNKVVHVGALSSWTRVVSDSLLIKNIAIAVPVCGKSVATLLAIPNIKSVVELCAVLLAEYVFAVCKCKTEFSDAYYVNGRCLNIHKGCQNSYHHLGRRRNTIISECIAKLVSHVLLCTNVSGKKVLQISFLLQYWQSAAVSIAILQY